MDYKEEQAQELEALQSIYPNELTGLYCILSEKQTHVNTFNTAG